MSEFLVGDELSARVRAIVDRGDPRLAIAFWGRAAAADLFEDEQAMRRAKIICDVSMGGTHHEALINLGAPGNARLKHIPGLHAKVCLSKEGMVVGSANASDRGIGFAGRSAKNFEAGAFYSPDSDAWATASKWFNARFRIASQVDDAAVDWARKSWRTPPPRIVPKPNSILDAIRLAPDRYRDLAIFFEKVSVTAEEAREYRTASRRTAAIAADIATIDGCGDNDIFSGLRPQQVERTSPFFLEYWKPNGRELQIFARQVVHRDPINGILYAKRAAAKLTAMRPDLPRLSDAAKMDDAVAGRILGQGRYGVRFFTPSSLVEVLV